MQKKKGKKNRTVWFFVDDAQHVYIYNIMTILSTKAGLFDLKDLHTTEYIIHFKYILQQQYPRFHKLDFK